jgi:DNA polymerase-3 subunit delta
MGILALVLRQLRIFALINAGMKKGFSGQRLSSYVGVPEFFLKKYMIQARHWDEGKIQIAIRALTETDRALKSSRVSSHIWLENFILKTC